MDEQSSNQAAERSVWINGRILPESKAGFSLSGSGLTGGWGLFETLGTRGGEPFAFARHWQRLESGARLLGISLPEKAEVVGGLHDLMEANRLAEARLRITLSAAMPTAVGDGLAAPLCILQALVMPSADRAGIEVITLPRWRYAEHPLASCKCVSYADNLLALRRAYAAGADEALLGNHRDELCEGATSNVWVMCGGQLITPALDSGCLPGVGRSILLEVCRQQGILVREEKIPLRVLDEVEECFLTSSLRGVRSVVGIDGRALLEQRMAERLREIWGGLAVDY